MKILGQKVNERGLKRLGAKVAKSADVIGRKTINTLDKVAPMASMIALAAGHPELAAAIGAGQALAHSSDTAIRSGVKVANSNNANRADSIVAFGENVDNVKRDADILRRY